MKDFEYPSITLDEALKLPSILTVSTRKSITILGGLIHNKLIHLSIYYGKNEISSSIIFSLLFRCGCSLFYHKYNTTLEKINKLHSDKVLACDDAYMDLLETPLTIRFKFGIEKHTVTISETDRKYIRRMSRILNCTMMDLGSYIILKAISSATVETTPKYIIDECIEKVAVFEHGMDVMINTRKKILEVGTKPGE
jgi:hypothetical protein